MDHLQMYEHIYIIYEYTQIIIPTLLSSIHPTAHIYEWSYLFIGDIKKVQQLINTRQVYIISCSSKAIVSNIINGCPSTRKQKYLVRVLVYYLTLVHREVGIQITCWSSSLQRHVIFFLTIFNRRFDSWFCFLVAVCMHLVHTYVAS